MSKYPAIIAYQPPEGENKHANFGWVGFVGLLTGVSEKMSIGQKVWIAKGQVKTTRYGNPWTYVLRDVLYSANNVQQALEILTNARRTCSVHLGLGFKYEHTFRMMLYAEKVLINYDDKNYTYTKYHPKKEGIAYFDKYVQPSKDECVGFVLTHVHYKIYSHNFMAIGTCRHSGVF
jgi:hypothetical protein